MAHLIDKAALVAEIERLRALLPDAKDCNYLQLEFARGQQDAFTDFEEFVNTLEVKEVDLDKAIDDYIYTHDGRKRMALEPDWKYCSLTLKGGDEIIKFAKHFYELGLKTQNQITISQQRLSVLKMEFWTGLQTFDNSEMTLSDAYNQGINDILEELGINAQKGE